MLRKFFYVYRSLIIFVIFVSLDNLIEREFLFESRELSCCAIFYVRNFFYKLLKQSFRIK